MANKQTQTRAIFLLGVLFFLFGFVTWLNGSLIPFLKVICNLSDMEALFVTFSFYIAYTVMAYPVSFVLEKTGYKKGMSLGLFVMGLGSLLFIPAALSGAFGVFLVALFFLGTGLTLLQSASNPYIVLVGPIESAARRISIMGVLNKLAGVVAPLVFTAVVLRNFPSDISEATNTRELAYELIYPYTLMAMALFALAVFVYFSSLQEIKTADDDSYDNLSVFAFAHVVLGAITLFFYVGIEVIAGDTIGLYAHNIGVANSSSFTAYTMGFMVLGYIFGILLIPRYMSQKTALKLSAILGIALSVLIFFADDGSDVVSGFVWGWSGLDTIPDTLFFIAMLGLANALVWPSIWPLVLEGLGHHTPKASALLIISIAGGAILPLLFAKVAQISASMQTAYLVLGLVCYVMVFMYGYKWYAIRKI